MHNEELRDLYSSNIVKAVKPNIMRGTGQGKWMGKLRSKEYV
jgi:hypothetical protein